MWQLSMSCDWYPAKWSDLAQEGSGHVAHRRRPIQPIQFLTGATLSGARGHMAGGMLSLAILSHPQLGLWLALYCQAQWA
jgi:hypothetical protein